MGLTAGTKLGAYELEGLLGAGGMGEVYRARDPRLNREVAIKILPASFASDNERLRRFEQEARAAAALSHPNILAVHDIGAQDGTPYIVSELLDGETLRERLRRGPLPARKAMDYGQQIARGLGAAHEKGIVHRDLKPENIFITHDGRAKILDFGLAKLTLLEPLQDGKTQSIDSDAGMVLGTVGYMSPEQVRGMPADGRSDLFSFGAIMYEMLSGKRAFKGETSADTMSAILHQYPPELTEADLNVPPALERLVQHCLEKSPAERFRSACDVAFDLETLLNNSVPGKLAADALLKQGGPASSRRKLLSLAGVFGLAAAMLGLGGWLARSNGTAPPPEYQQITFRTGIIGNARFTPDGSIVYDALWEGSEGERQLFLARTDDTTSHELGLKNATLLSISKRGELAIRLNTVAFSGYERKGTLARVPLSGVTPREVSENVQDADWAPDGESMAVVRFVPEDSHWRLEYPIGKVLFDSINWISHPKISQDGKWVAFVDHENTGGDDQGSVAVIGPDGNEKKLSSGWTSIEGILWSPKFDEIWFSASDNGGPNNLRGVTLAGKLRKITNVPGGMWLQDLRDGVALMITDQERLGIRGISPMGKELELGWLGSSYLRDITPDGRKVLFNEEGDGGGPNYTVFVRDTDGSPPVRIGEGRAMAISPDSKWVITKPAKGGPLNVVPTGAGEARQLTHDNINYGQVRFLPDRKQLLAAGIEAGHGVRDYLIDLGSGNAKPITPEGVSGVVLSPDRNVAVTGPDGTWGIWNLDRSSLHPVPGLDSKYYVSGWTPDGTSVYALSSATQNAGGGPAKVYRVNTTTGKIELWKSIGTNLPSGSFCLKLLFPSNGSSYAYEYLQDRTEAYIVKGLK